MPFEQTFFPLGDNSNLDWGTFLLGSALCIAGAYATYKIIEHYAIIKPKTNLL